MSNFYDYMFSANKNATSGNEKVVEDKKDDYHTTRFYTICCQDGEKSLLDLINYIAKNGNGGHSFDIVVDPDDKKNERHFFWDGDGSDRIKSVVASTTGEDKELVGILLKALARIDTQTWIEGVEEEVDKQRLLVALSNIQNITREILDGADFEDYMKDALQEVKFILTNDDSAEKKLEDIKYIVEETLK